MINRGRFQAQGMGTEKSQAWAMEDHVYKDDGTRMLSDLENQLTRIELTNRINALQKARNFVENCPIGGVLPLKKSFPNNLKERSIRIDVEVNAGVAFLTRPIL